MICLQVSTPSKTMFTELVERVVLAPRVLPTHSSHQATKKPQRSWLRSWAKQIKKSRRSFRLWLGLGLVGVAVAVVAEATTVVAVVAVVEGT